MSPLKAHVNSCLVAVTSKHPALGRVGSCVYDVVVVHRLRGTPRVVMNSTSEFINVDHHLVSSHRIEKCEHSLRFLPSHRSFSNQSNLVPRDTNATCLTGAFSLWLKHTVFILLNRESVFARLGDATISLEKIDPVSAHAFCKKNPSHFFVVMTTPRGKQRDRRSRVTNTRRGSKI
jgi:hypothetical protein